MKLSAFVLAFGLLASALPAEEGVALEARGQTKMEDFHFHLDEDSNSDVEVQHPEAIHMHSNNYHLDHYTDFEVSSADDLSTAEHLQAVHDDGDYDPADDLSQTNDLSTTEHDDKDLDNDRKFSVPYSEADDLSTADDMQAFDNHMDYQRDHD